MNPHAGQYRLGGTLDGWSRLNRPTPAQWRRLGLSYRGLVPWVYSRYGVRQWAAPLPWTRLVVKDPFAVLSIPTVANVTGALTVLVYRHPGAVLTSYRRMGWRPDMAEISALLELDPSSADDCIAPPIVADMARFWTALHRTVLQDTEGRADVIIVSHEELARGGPGAMALLASSCGLVLQSEPASSSGPAASASPDTQAEPPVVSEPTMVPESQAGRRLHNFDRRPQDVAGQWRSSVSDAELEILERYAGGTLETLESLRLPFTAAPDSR